MESAEFGKGKMGVLDALKLQQNKTTEIIHFRKNIDSVLKSEVRFLRCKCLIINILKYEIFSISSIYGDNQSQKRNILITILSLDIMSYIKFF